MLAIVYKSRETTYKSGFLSSQNPVNLGHPGSGLLSWGHLLLLDRRVFCSLLQLRGGSHCPQLCVLPGPWTHLSLQPLLQAGFFPWSLMLTL